ncbi:MAG: ankyrin repeat domain-containing protein [Gemmatimonadota bacterium]
MYPNPQDVLPLPPRPSPAQYRTRAKELVEASHCGIDGIRTWAARWVEALLRLLPDERSSPRDPRRYVHELADFAHARLVDHGSNVSQALFVIARAHGFPSWTALLCHIESLVREDSPAGAFERAADAIVAGDLSGLEQVLAAHPSLLHARSTREHRATLLHYVAANGVENYRQRTPPNIVALTRLLLDAGADIDAEADVYGGGATTLGLVATSAHPRRRGVQNDLIDLLLERGAALAPGMVRACLANGCPEAGAHLAARGAALDLVEAAGIGRVDVIERWIQSTPFAPASAEAVEALLMAAWYDQRPTLAVLLDAGVDPSQRAADDGRTALHLAAYEGHAALVELLLARGAEIDALDGRYGTPPLVWALHAWLEEGRSPDPYRRTVGALVAAGAHVDPAWIDEPRLAAEPEVLALLRQRAGGG